jgi:putative nucleotidyltransferase with HDIG domain
MQNIANNRTDASQMRLDLLDKIWKRLGAAKRADSLIASITHMTRCALNATAASLFILDEDSQRLLLKFADGPVGKQLKKFQMSTQSGIAGWVARYGRPLIVNNVNEDQRFNRQIDEVTGFVTRSIVCAPLVLQDKVIGVIEVINKIGGGNFTGQDSQTLTGVATTAALTIENIRLHGRLQDSYKNTVNALVSLADAKEINGAGHSQRVAEYALMGANYLSLPEAEKQAIEYAAILHDIGKLRIPESILNKSGSLTHEEWQIMRQHPGTGYDLLKKIPFLEEASKLILGHHERYDGKGYPRGLKGEAIPMGARLIAVADAFDNMTTEHCYRAALGRKHAFTELSRCARTQFCPVAVKAFCSGFLHFHLSAKQ